MNRAKKQLHTKVVKAIKDSSLSFYKLEEGTGVSRETLRHLYKGLRDNVSLEILFKIADFFQIKYKFETNKSPDYTFVKGKRGKKVLSKV
ncbi:MAG: helix-turn-helix transcriptional regulator [Spirochaetota bacterium]